MLRASLIAVILITSKYTALLDFLLFCMPSLLNFSEPLVRKADKKKTADRGAGQGEANANDNQDMDMGEGGGIEEWDTGGDAVGGGDIVGADAGADVDIA